VTHWGLLRDDWAPARKTEPSELGRERSSDLAGVLAPALPRA
jgi:hypothetical protein